MKCSVMYSKRAKSTKSKSIILSPSRSESIRLYSVISYVSKVAVKTVLLRYPD
jgi:hypothetical protein